MRSVRAAGESEMGMEIIPKERKPFHVAAIQVSSSRKLTTGTFAFPTPFCRAITSLLTKKKRNKLPIGVPPSEPAGRVRRRRWRQRSGSERAGQGREPAG